MILRLLQKFKKAHIPTKRQISCVADKFLKMVTDCTEFLALAVASTVMFMRKKNVEFSLIHSTFKSIMLFDHSVPINLILPKGSGYSSILPTIHLEVLPNLEFAFLNGRLEGLHLADDITIEFP